MRGDRGAPSFNETPRGLKRFFRDVERMFDAQGVPRSDALLIEWAVTWASTDVQDLFESFLTTGMSWAEFQAKAMAYYPGADGTRQYVVSDIERLAHEWAAKGVYTRVDLGEYLRQFQILASDLLANRKVDEGLLERLFMQGFGEATRRKIESRLRIVLPNHFYDDPYPRKEVENAALFVLSATPADSEDAGNATSHAAPVVKTEDTSLANTLIMIQNSIAQLTLALTAANKPPPHNHSSQQAQSSNQPRTRGCLFCSSLNHFINDCETLNEYIGAGKCIRNENHKVVLPDGRFLPRSIQGDNLKIRFDIWWTTHPASPATGANKIPTASVNMLSVAVFQNEETPTTRKGAYIEDYVSDDEVANDAFATEGRKGRKTVIVEVPRVQKAREVQSTVHQQPPAVTVTPPSDPVAPASQPRTEGHSVSRIPAKDPQFHYSSPAEDSLISQRVFDKILDTSVTLTTRELCAVSLDARKRMKEFVTSKRYPNTTALVDLTEAQAEFAANPQSQFLADVFHNESVRPTFREHRTMKGIAVADASVPLRCVSVTLNDKVDIDATIDCASSIVAINKETWEKTGLSCSPDQAIKLRSAQNTLAMTKGMLGDLPVSIGSATIYLQVQVAPSLPCPMLLGLPFFKLSSAHLAFRPSGEAELLIQDPNTLAVLALPTRPVTDAPQTRREGGFH